MKTKTAVIVQCRMSSTRLPGKALMPLGGKPVLAWVLSAMRKVRADSYYVATDEASAAALEPVCAEYGFGCHAGPLDDVLERYCGLIRKINAETVVRATADNPFLFYEAAQESLDEFVRRRKGRNPCDYLTFTGLPHGSGVEVFSGAALLKAAELTESPFDREHVGPALYNHQDQFRCDFIPAPPRYSCPSLRTTIDTYSDYIRASAVVMENSGGIKPDGPYTSQEILSAVRSRFAERPVIMVPSVKKGQGTGHLRRCLEVCRDTGFFCLVPGGSTLSGAQAVVDEYMASGLVPGQVIGRMPGNDLRFVAVTDLFRTEEPELDELRNAEFIVALDEGGENSVRADYLLDIIPSYKMDRNPNLFDTAFIGKPRAGCRRNSDGSFRSPQSVLVCLGGEDPAGLTVPAAEACARAFSGAQVTAVVPSAENGGATDGNSSGSARISFVGPIRNLRDKIGDYDLVVTHYGLTAFEAAVSGCAVILLATTKLHERLAEKYKFAFIPEKRLRPDDFIRASLSRNIYPELPVSTDSRPLPEFLKSICSGRKLLCPVCGTVPQEPDPVVSRNVSKTYRRCSSCGLVYMSWTDSPPKTYRKSYFFEEYRNQYGKTYEEDFPAIKRQGVRRMSVMDSVHRKGGRRTLLDIGCAYGPFLAAASEAGWTAFGTDISDDAVGYVQNRLHFPAVRADFPEIDTASEFGVNHFDAVTMWYVIEHFSSLDAVLRKVNSLLRKGGIFAFSTPSAEGISCRSDRDAFFAGSPADHYSVWEPSAVAGILGRYGFSVVRKVSTGHHPERFPSVKKSGCAPDSVRWKLTGGLSRIRHLGDTVEIYCVKRQDIK